MSAASPDDSKSDVDFAELLRMEFPRPDSADVCHFFYSTKTIYSQWHPKSFEVDGQVYPTAEHWMMAQKAVVFKDDATLAKILASKTPRDVKKLGRQVRNFNEGLWNCERERIVCEGNYYKFSQNPDLLEKLLETGDQYLVEASPHDRIWGIGASVAHAKKMEPKSWNGYNLLGIALMRVRHALRR